MEEVDVTSEVVEATMADVIVAKVEELLVEVEVGDWYVRELVISLIVVKVSSALEVADLWCFEGLTVC